MKRILYCISLLTIIACSSRSVNGPDYSVALPDWTIIKLRANHELIWVTRNDTVYYRAFTAEDTLSDVPNGIVKFKITTADRDSIVDWCFATIRHPYISASSLSDYAGDFITIQIENRSTALSIKYSSVKNWELLSTLLNKINRYTFERARKVRPPQQ